LSASARDPDTFSDVKGSAGVPRRSSRRRLRWGGEELPTSLHPVTLANMSDKPTLHPREDRAGQPVVAESGMAAYGTGIVESCLWCGLDAAGRHLCQIRQAASQGRCAGRSMGGC
jgi:hypothetical protein